MKRRGSAWAWFVFKAGTGILLAAAALDASGRLASADPTTEAMSPAPDPEQRVEPTVDEEVHVPGTPFPDGPDEIPFEKLSPADQDGVMKMAEWAETQSGQEVADGWSSSVTQPSVAAAKARKAEYASGTNGLSDVGVE